MKLDRKAARARLASDCFPSLADGEAWYRLLRVTNDDLGAALDLLERCQEILAQKDWPNPCDHCGKPSDEWDHAEDCDLDALLQDLQHTEKKP